jgi:hypothetical protein
MPHALDAAVRCPPLAAALAGIALSGLIAREARADTKWDDEKRNAAAEEHDASVWTKRRIAIDVHAGLGTPYGLTGASLEFTPIAYWTLGGGVGTSISGPQLALSTRVRYPIGHSAIAFGVGASRGAYDTAEAWLTDSLWRKHWDHAYWLNLEVSLERRWSSGVQFRMYGGVGTVVNPAAGKCEPDSNYGGHDCNSRGGPLGLLWINETTVPYVGYAVGYAFAP